MTQGRIMCGIFGYVATRNTQHVTGNRKLKDASKIVFEGLKRLEYRGYDSWGTVAISKIKNQKSKLVTEKHVGKIGDAKPSIVNRPASPAKRGEPSTIAIGHTRWATHGGVTVANAHPHLDCTGQIAIVHNGIIENFQSLKSALLKKGHKFISGTDSEVFAHLVEEQLKKADFADAVVKAFRKLAGRNAFALVNAKSEEMIGIRDGSPLIFGVGKGEYFIASDTPAFLNYTKKVVFLNDRQGVVISNGNFEVFSIDKGRIKPKIETVSWNVEQAEKGKYPHFLLKEILEQGKTISLAAKQDEKSIKNLAGMIDNAFGVYLVACGTASYAALYGTYVFSQVAKKHINWAIGSEFADCQHFLTAKSLVIAVSQSGETADTLEAVKIAKQKGAKTVAIVNVTGSSLARLADYSVLTNAGLEIAVVSTKAFTSQLAVLLLLAWATAGKLAFGQRLIARAANAVDKMLTDKFCAHIKNIADKLKDHQHIYVIGKGQNYPIALEAALKIKEASYIHGEGFAAGELKHGVIALISKGTPCVCVFGEDQDKSYILGSAMEMKARGGYIIGIGPKENEVFDEFIKVADIPDASAIVNTPAVQLLAYYLAVLRGNNPDRPRNLAKSVTVK